MMRPSLLTRMGLPAFVSILTAVPALAQSTGRAEGIVTDQSGAAVPGVTITATNVDTNVSKSAVTDQSGSYVLTPLPVGAYRVRAELSGFKSAAAGMTLDVNEVERLDFRLEVGQQSETVEVRAAAPIIEKSTSFIGTVVDHQQVEDLPLNGRNFTQLTTLSPGVTRGTPGSAAAGQSGQAETFRYGEFGGTSISVNGLREQFNTYLLDGIDDNETLVNGIAYIPSPEVIEQFRVITTNAPAEFGRAGGAIQSIVTKSGGNQFHGSAYYYQRPGGMAATPAFASEKPDFENKDFGATLDGPIVKDRTFFFASYHGLRSSIPVEAGNKVTVPTAAMRNGDFSELLDPALTGLGAPVVIYDPRSGQPYPGNVIPASQIDPVAQAYLNVFPLPSQPGVLRNYLTHRQKKTNFDDVDARIDHHFNTNDQIFFRASFWTDEFSDPGHIPGYQAGFGSGTSRNKGKSLGFGVTHVFSSTIVNEVRLGFIDFGYEFLPVGFGTDQDAALGIPGPGGITVDNGISLIGGGDGRYIEFLGDFGQYQINQTTVQLADTVTWLRGAHTWKFGGTIMRRGLQQTRTQYGKGFYNYDGDAVLAPNTPARGYTGYEVADILVSATNFTATGVPGYIPRDAISWENSIFVQDDWRVSRKLTLNLGLRWDVFNPYYEKDDKLANYDPTTETLVLPGRNGVPRSTLDPDWNNLGPRVGFAYQVGSKSVLRGSYGIFYTLDRGGIDNQLTENPPAVVTEFRFGDAPGARVRLSNPIPLPTQVDPANPVLAPGSGLVYVPRDTKTTSVQQFSVSGQRELGHGIAGMLAYVGTRGDNLTARLTAAGFAGNIADRLTTLKNVGTSRYDAMQVQLRRTAPDFSFLASYTLGWAHDDVPSLFPGSPSRGAAVTDPNDLSRDYGYADYDSRNRFTLAATYRLPFAKGNAILGGWTVNGVVTLQSGTPFTAYASGGGALRVNQSGDISYPETRVNNSDGTLNYVQWVDPNSFSQPEAGQTQGTAARNSVRGPGISTVDLSLFKLFDLGKRVHLEIRLEGFNVFDHAQYSQPNQAFDDPNFGRITGTLLNSERQFQLAARLTF